MKIKIKFKNENIFLGIMGIVLLACIMILSIPKTRVTIDINADLEGNGTLASPFLVSDAYDLLWIQEAVNAGNEFDGCYFKQTSNLDLDEFENWVPIGNDQYSFAGVYDGNGHYIKNLYINADDAALFHDIRGAICNLGIESGNIVGNRCASFAMGEKSKDALIINCYSKAKLQGVYVGGIANCFHSGKIVCCWTDCEMISDQPYGILCDGSDVKIYGCSAASEILCPSIIPASVSYSKTISELYDENQVQKYNHCIALAQGLFADKYRIKLKEYDQYRHFCDSGKIIHIYEILNDWTLPLLGMLLLIIILHDYWKQKDNRIWLFIVVIVTFFTDVFGIYLGTENIHISGWLLLFELNYAFLVSLYMEIKKRGFYIGLNLHKNRYMYLVILAVIFFELLQFGDMPHFDGTLYYGSLVRSIDEFRLNLFTYAGAFVCWKEIQGLALFIAPWECLFHGEMIGVYIGNMCISIITIYFFFELFKAIYPHMSEKFIALFCLCFFFFPYAMGLFTYLCMDYQLPLFAVWFMCGLAKKDDKLISFSGFLLSFTKITGFVFYVLALFFYFCIEIIFNQKQNKQGIHNIIKKYRSKIVYWGIPVVEYLVMYICTGRVAIQNFFGSYQAESPIGLKNFNEAVCTIFQSLAYGFRWLMILMAIIAVINICFDKREKSGLSIEGKKILVSALAGCLAVVFLLLIYNGDAMCPRYTAVLNIGYIIILPFALYNCVGNKMVLVKLSTGIVTALMIVQTYFNIDPTMLINYAIDLGKTSIYAGVPGSINTITWNDMPVLNDCYVYNYQHNAYSNLMNVLFEKINPTAQDNFYVLDTHEYELNISGSWNRNYKIYWNSRKKRFDFDEWDKDSTYLNVCPITSAGIYDGIELGDRFYLIIPDRVDDNVVDYWPEQDYHLEQEYLAHNIYASVKILLISR